MIESRGTVLLVDDEQPIRYALSALLDMWGYESFAVSTGREALDALTSSEFDLILLDVRMPGMSGLEVLKNLRVDNPGITVIMLSAVNDNELMGEAMKLGADDYVIKPCNPEDLSKRLRRAFSESAIAERVPGV